MTEHRLQQAVSVYLTRALPPDTFWTSVDAGQGRMDPIAGCRRRERGIKAGVPDLLLCWRGRLHGIELKFGKGTLSDNQVAIANEILAAGGLWAMCRSVEEVEVVLRRWGLPLRATAWAGTDIDARLAARDAAPKSKPRTRSPKPKPDAAMIRRLEAVRARKMF